jgi:hypothetical protein
MTNEYKLFKDYAEIYLKYKGESYTTYVSLEDFDRVSSINKSWLIFEHHGIKYAVYYKNLGNRKQQKIRMHRFILDAPESSIIDHKDHNGLNNRRLNLVVTNNQNNLLNMKHHDRYPAYISYQKDKDMYRVRIQKNHIGYRDTLEEAIELRDSQLMLPQYSHLAFLILKSSS